MIYRNNYLYLTDCKQDEVHNETVASIFKSFDGSRVPHMGNYSYSGRYWKKSGS